MLLLNRGNKCMKRGRHIRPIRVPISMHISSFMAGMSAWVVLLRILYLSRLK